MECLLCNLPTNIDSLCNSPQVQHGPIQQASKSSVAPLTLPRLNVPSTPTPAVHNSNNNSNGGIHHNEKNKSSMPLSPLANGCVTVTNQLQPNLGDVLSTTRQTMQTKYVTRPQTPVTPKTFAMNLTSHHPGQPGHQRLPHCQTMTLPGRGTRSSTRTNSQHFMTDEKFSIQPPPTFAYPDHNSDAWHSSTLPRLVRHLPATSQVRLLSPSWKHGWLFI